MLKWLLMNTCKIDKCSSKIVARELCSKHYHRQYRYGDTNFVYRERTLQYRDTPEYRAWKNIKSRCYNKNVPSYKYYGGRGIGVCDRWRKSFYSFLNDMGQRPGAEYSIDRKNNDGDYSPDNCRWATKSQQGVNTRLYKTNKTGFRNVSLSKNGKYVVRIRRDKVEKYLGIYESIDEARSIIDEYLSERARAYAAN